MAGWHHWLDAHEFGWTPGVGDGQGGLACCDSWGRKELDTTEWLNWTVLNCYPFLPPNSCFITKCLHLFNHLFLSQAFVTRGGLETTPFLQRRCGQRTWGEGLSQEDTIGSCVCVHTQSCPTLCNPMDYSLPGSLVQRIFQKEYWRGLPFPVFQKIIPTQG